MNGELNFEGEVTFRDAEFRNWVEREVLRADALDAVDRNLEQTDEILRLSRDLFGDSAANQEIERLWAKERRELYARVTGHLPGMRTRRRWWQRRVPVVVPESLVRGAMHSAWINRAISFNATLAEGRRRVEADLSQLRALRERAE